MILKNSGIQWITWIKKIDIIFSFQKEINEDNLMNKQEKQPVNKMKKKKEPCTHTTKWRRWATKSRSRRRPKSGHGTTESRWRWSPKSCIGSKRRRRLSRTKYPSGCTSEHGTASLRTKWTRTTKRLRGKRIGTWITLSKNWLRAKRARRRLPKSCRKNNSNLSTGCESNQ